MKRNSRNNATGIRLSLKQYLRRKFYSSSLFRIKNVALTPEEIQVQKIERHKILDKLFKKPKKNIIKRFKLSFRKGIIGTKRRLNRLHLRHRRFTKIKIKKRRLRKRLRKKFILKSIPVEKRVRLKLISRIRKYLRRRDKLLRGRRKMRLNLNVKGIKHVIKKRFRKRLHPGKSRARLE